MDLTFENSINPDNFTFNVSVLKQFSAKELSLWLKNNYSTIQKHLISRYRLLLEENPGMLQEAARFPQLKRASEVALSIYRDSQTLHPHVHYFALFGMSTPTSSCHEVIFGEKNPVVLRGQILNIMRLYATAPAQLQQQLLDELRSNPSNVTNPVYTSLCRYKELAMEDGRQVNQWLSDYCYFYDFVDTVSEFTEDRVKEYDELLSSRSSGIGPSCLWWMALLFCPVTGVSADYLYREDYSFLAVLPERHLSEDERIFLSAYLTASEHCQQQCRFTLLESQV